MKCIYTERLVLTKEEAVVLDKARKLLENIFKQVKKDDVIEDLSWVAYRNICDLLSDDYSDIE